MSYRTQIVSILFGLFFVFPLWGTASNIPTYSRAQSLQTDSVVQPNTFPDSIIHPTESKSILQRTWDLSKRIVNNGFFKVGVNVGATSPFRLPEGARIQSFAPIFAPIISFSRGIDFNKWVGLSIGAQFEYKGMTTRAHVHDYYTEVTKELEGSVARFRGTFTGSITTQVTISYATLPVLFCFHFSPRYTLKLGGYASYVLSHSFTGSVENGYVWTQPASSEESSDKIMLEHEEYSFSKNMRKWDTGIDLRGEHRITERSFIEFGATLGMLSIFEKGFTGISYSMQNIYINLGVGYNFPIFSK